MSIAAERKQALIKEYAARGDDTGSPEVQVAILTERIKNLTDHFQDPQERQPFAARSAEAGQPAPGAARLSEIQKRLRYKTLIERLGIRRCRCVTGGVGSPPALRLTDGIRAMGPLPKRPNGDAATDFRHEAQ